MALSSSQPTTKPNTDTARITSHWARESLWVCQKDLIAEWRAKSSLLTSALFVFSITTALSFSVSRAAEIKPDIHSGLLWAILLFCCYTAWSRGFIAEEERKTSGWLQLYASSSGVFWGKFLFLLIYSFALGSLCVLFYVLFSSLTVGNWLLFALVIVAGLLCMSLAGNICGALAAGAEHRSALTIILAVPVLLPVLFLALTGTSAVLKGVELKAFSASLLGLISYFIGMGIMAPLLFKFLWRENVD